MSRYKRLELNYFLRAQESVAPSAGVSYGGGAGIVIFMVIVP